MIRIDCVLVVIMLVVIFPLVLAGQDRDPEHDGKIDDYLKERAEKAIIEAMKSYQPHPEEVTRTFTEQVSEWVIFP